MPITDDPNDPRIKRGRPDEHPIPMNDTYLVLSAAERAKGFVRPVRRRYRHVGIDGPAYSLVDLTEEQIAQFIKVGYVKFEPYPKDSHGSAIGRYWTQKQLNSVGNRCGMVTTMGQELAETYARNPGFYGSTYCCGCNMHRPVGVDSEFIWDDGSEERVGT